MLTCHDTRTYPGGMAADIARTVRDDVADALDALDTAAREIENWRAHLSHAAVNPAPGVAMQARRSSQVVAGIIADAAQHTTDAAYRASEALLNELDARERRAQPNSVS